MPIRAPTSRRRSISAEAARSVASSDGGQAGFRVFPCLAKKTCSPGEHPKPCLMPRAWATFPPGRKSRTAQATSTGSRRDRGCTGPLPGGLRSGSGHSRSCITGQECTFKKSDRWRAAAELQSAWQAPRVHVYFSWRSGDGVAEVVHSNISSCNEVVDRSQRAS